MNASFTITDNCPPPPSAMGTIGGKKSPSTIAFESLKPGQCINFGVIDKKRAGTLSGSAFSVAKKLGFKICTRKVNGEFRVYRTE